MGQNEGTAAAHQRELRRGDVVRVRPPQEILASLDANGDLDRLPFMPEMLSFIGEVHTVAARADKTCDTVDLTGTSRGLDSTVHLVGARCDGSAHGGCQAGCLLFFKEEWLEPATDGATAEDPTAREELRRRVEKHSSPAPDLWRCQATALPEASHPLRAGIHYLRDLQTHNVPVRLFLRSLRIRLFDRYQRFSHHRLPAWARYRGGHEQPDLRGSLRRTPRVDLNLQPGELVEVRSLPEIVSTLDANQKNRNLWFDREMVRYCGKRFRVVRRVDRLLDEKTGRMIETSTPSVILDGAVCVGDFHKLCPRQDHAFFREAWLTRVEPARTTTGPPGSATTAPTASFGGAR